MQRLPSPSAPTVSEVQRIVAIPNPVLRNLEITWCYSQLAAECRSWTGAGANWCTYATWASRQAGATIRGEDLLENLEWQLGNTRWLLHPFATFWRRLLRRGVFQPDTRVGRLTHQLHTPFDAFEQASDAVARGNLKVFEEIGLQFARYLEARAGNAMDVQRFLETLRPGDPPAGQELLRRAFERYSKLQSEQNAKTHAELALLANLEIGLHEQTRLQPEIFEALNAPYATKKDLGRRVLEALAPSSTRWWRPFRTPVTAVVEVVARAVQRAAAKVARETITTSLMVLSLPGRKLALGSHLGDAYPDALADPVDPELRELLEALDPVPADCGARDWSKLDQRMHYLAHLFRAMHLSERLDEPPFSDEQLASIRRARIPAGDL